MLNLLNRMAWIISIIAWISIYSIDNEFFIFWIIAIFIVKIILSKDFIQNSLDSQKLNIKTSEKDVKQKNELPKNLNIDLKEVAIYDEYIPTNTPKPKKEEPKKISNTTPTKFQKYLNDFFSQNLMAKIGWILLTLWIIFLMSLVYSAVWPVLKIIIWFIVWFVVYFIWVILQNKWFKIEWMILLWTWILINYVVILWGRFFIWENDWVLSSSLTFILLILNTIFSILTSYIYSSKNLLLFSIFFAYFIPFLVWSSNSKYSYLIVVWYSVILSIASFFISWKKFLVWEINTSKILMYFSLIFWNILVLASPLTQESSFIIKIIWFNIITFLNIYLSYKNKFNKDILILFILSFVFFGINLITWISGLWAGFKSIFVFFSYIISILLVLISVSFFTIIWFWAGIMYLLFAPLIIFLCLLFSWNLFWAIFLIPIILLIYIAIFALISTKIIWSVFKYLFFIVIWVFLLISNSYFIDLSLNFDFKTQLSMLFTAFIFLFSTYYLSSKKELSYFYSVWTLISIFLLLPVIKISWSFIYFSIFWVILFWVLNYLLPFFNKNLANNDSINLVLGNIFWILFIWWNLFRFWNEYFPWITMWISFLLLAILYFIWSYFVFSKITKDKQTNKEINLNFIYSLTWISVSLFSISIALIFSDLPIVISLIWLLESTILTYFASRLKSQKIYVASVVLLIIWVYKIFALLFNNSVVYLDLISLFFIISSLFLNVFFLKKSELVWKNFIKILHILWLIWVYLLVIDIFPNRFELLVTAFFLLILSVLYNLLKDNFLKKAFIFFLIFSFLVHSFITNEIQIYYLNYLFTLISGVILFLEYFFFKDNNTKNIAISYFVYFVIITSIYLYNYTNDYFSLTIYWWVLSLILVHLWISKTNKYIRWAGLYLLITTLLKISFYDSWNSIDNPIIRVVAFIFVWGIMMYISTLYTKNKLILKSDLDVFSNENLTPKINNNPLKEPKINLEELIKDIDVWEIESIKFNCNNSNTFTIRSKKLFKIAVMIKNNLWKTTFLPKELKDIYDLIISNNKTELNSNDYNKLISILKEFAEFWWNVEFNYKK